MPETDDQPKKAKPKRKWLRRLGWTGIVCVGAGFAINGPVARWGVKYSLDKLLASQGMQGDAKVSGSLARGFTVQDLYYSGEKGLQLLDIKYLDVDYRITELLDQKIRVVSLSDAKASLDVAKFPHSEETPSDPHAKLRDILSIVRSWVTKPEISIERLDVEILSNGETQANFSLGTLTHDAGSSLIQLNDFVATDGSGNSTPGQKVDLTWNEASATIDHFEILPEIALRKVEADWSSIPQGTGTLLFYDAELNLSIQEKVTANLAKGKLRTDQITERFGIELPVSTAISSLELTLDNWEKTPVPLWQIETSISADFFNYDKYQAKDLKIQLNQTAGKYQAELTGTLNETAISAKTQGTWDKPESEQWWKHINLTYELSTPKLGELVALWYALPEDIYTDAIAIDSSGSFALDGEVIDHITLTADINGARAKETPFPQLKLDASYSSTGDIKAKLTSDKQLAVEVAYNLETQGYQGRVDLDNNDTAWINTLCEIYGANVIFKAPLKLSWNGSGNIDLDKPQTGSLKVDKLHLSTEEVADVSASTDISYNYPQSINVHSLNVSESEWNGNAKISWDGKLISIEEVKIRNLEEQVADIHGKLPYNVKIDSLKSFLAQDEEWNLAVDTKKLALPKIHQWFSIEKLEGFNGNIEVDFKLTGQPKKPVIDGKVSVLGFTGLDDEHLAPLNLTSNFKSQEDQLKLQALLNEGEAERVKISGSFPFTPEDWLEDPNLLDTLLNKAPINAQVSISKLPLARFKKFLTQLEEIEGNVDGTATITGTLHDPKYTADIHADMPVLKIGIKEFRDARKVKIDAKINEQLQTGINLTAQINGGEFTITGKADLKEFKNPSFDINLKTRYALAHRDDLVSVRANTDVNLKGTLEDATISGRIGIVESLIYKDIELIPIGVPSSAVAEVKLPVIDPEKADAGLPIPEPFGNWKLNLTIFTQDPILARGNIASGYANGSLQVGGTLKNPAPNGKLNIRNVKAKLPFSVLEIQQGTITFTPAGGLIPSLDIRGKSSIGSYDVNVFVYGSASAPKTAFSSYPPLPESEVMALIATGSTTSGLEDQEVATFKAFQIFLLKMRQRADAPGGNKLFASLLKGVENLNLNVGDKNAFTGKEYYSATIELTPSWHLTAQVDNEQQTRGLVIYVIRFR